LFVVLLVIAPPSQELEPPTNPARFTSDESGAGALLESVPLLLPLWNTAGSVTSDPDELLPEESLVPVVVSVGPADRAGAAESDASSVAAEEVSVASCASAEPIGAKRQEKITNALTAWNTASRLLNEDFTAIA
jgi:hypothetical protein